VILRHHYRSSIDFNDKLFKDNLNTINNFYRNFDEKLLAQENITVDLENEIVVKMDKEFNDIMEDDLNTPLALVMFSKYLKESARPENAAHKNIIHSNIIRLGRVIGLFSANYNLKRVTDELLKFQQTTIESDESLLVSDIENILTEREEARKSKDYAKSDELRDKLTAHGLRVMDDQNAEHKWQFSGAEIS